MVSDYQYSNALCMWHLTFKPPAFTAYICMWYMLQLRLHVRTRITYTPYMYAIHVCNSGTLV